MTTSSSQPEVQEGSALAKMMLTRDEHQQLADLGYSEESFMPVAAP